MATHYAAVIGLLALALCACLGVDEQAQPGRVEVRVALESDGADFVTDDGFRIRYDELLISAGNARLDRGSYDGSCKAYTGTTYLRVVDLLESSARLATLFALGDCSVRVQLMGPSDDYVVTDVDDASLASMQARASDGFVQDESVALRVAGHAERSGDRYDFEWSFRQAFDVDPCVVVPFDPDEPSVLELRMRAARLFLDGATGQLSFAPFAEADADGDKSITLAELANVPLGQRLYFENVPQLLWVGDEPPCFVGRVRGEP
jgi:hypothetical protein